MSIPGLSYGRTGSWALAVWVKKDDAPPSTITPGGDPAFNDDYEGADNATDALGSSPASAAVARAIAARRARAAAAAAAAAAAQPPQLFEYLISHSALQPGSALAKNYSAFAPNQVGNLATIVCVVRPFCHTRVGLTVVLGDNCRWERQAAFRLLMHRCTHTCACCSMLCMFMHQMNWYMSPLHST